MLQNKVWRYDPGLVLLEFFAGNDVSDNVSELRGSGKSAYFELHDDELIVDKQFARKREKIERQSRIYDWWIEHSRVFQVIARSRAAFTAVFPASDMPRCGSA